MTPDTSLLPRLCSFDITKHPHLPRRQHGRQRWRPPRRRERTLHRRGEPRVGRRGANIVPRLLVTTLTRGGGGDGGDGGCGGGGARWRTWRGGPRRCVRAGDNAQPRTLEGRVGGVVAGQSEDGNVIWARRRSGCGGAPEWNRGLGRREGDSWQLAAYGSGQQCSPSIRAHRESPLTPIDPA